MFVTFDPFLNTLEEISSISFQPDEIDAEQVTLIVFLSVYSVYAKCWITITSFACTALKAKITLLLKNTYQSRKNCYLPMKATKITYMLFYYLQLFFISIFKATDWVFHTGRICHV